MFFNHPPLAGIPCPHCQRDLERDSEVPHLLYCCSRECLLDASTPDYFVRQGGRLFGFFVPFDADDAELRREYPST